MKIRLEMKGAETMYVDTDQWASTEAAAAKILVCFKARQIRVDNPDAVVRSISDALRSLTPSNERFLNELGLTVIRATESVV